MTRTAMRTSLVFMVLLSVLAVVWPVATSTSPTLGLDLRGGFSVVLQAREVDGRLPSEESVEEAKDIIRQRVDGLGVAEPDIARQGRTVLVQLPGVTNRQRAEEVVGCTARMEFRPVLARIPAPEATTPTDPTTPTTAADGATTTTVAGSDTSIDGSPSTTAAEGPDATVDGDGEGAVGAAGAGPGEGALPAQFAPSTTTTTTAPPATTTTVAPPTTVPATSTTVAEPTTTVPGTPTTVPAGTAGGGEGASSACGGGEPVDLPLDGFPEGTVGALDADGSWQYALGPVGFSGDALESAQATLDGGVWSISVSVKGDQRSQANEAFNACFSGQPTCPPIGDTSQGGGGAIAIVLDGAVLSAPSVNGQNLASDTFTISGDFSEGEAKDLAVKLRYGSLPVEFEQAELQQVSATLGEDSLRAGLIAGLIGIGLLGLYMVLYYRGFGMIVVVSLAVWAALMYGVVCLLSATQGLALTLAGITGIIVSVGTTVDTYVVVFERVKDEIRNGRSVRAATERGYQSGIRTVLTANSAAFIGAFLLWWLTVGPVRGFAYFLGLSVLLDMFVAIAFTRPLILLLGRSPRFARAEVFGIGASTDQRDLPKVVAS